MAKITAALLVLALFAMPFLNGLEAAGRPLPGKNDKLYEPAHFWWGLGPWGLLPFGLLHPWLFGPWWWLKDGKITTTQVSYYHSPKDGTLGNHASTSP